MTFSSKNTLLFRSAITVLFAFLLTVVVINFVKNASSTTDENYFADLESPFYLVKPVHVRESLSKINKMQILEPEYILLAIDGLRLLDTTSISNVLAKYKTNDNVSITVVNPHDIMKNNAKKIYYTSVNELKNGAVSYLSSAVIVLEVFKGGASERAGMRRWDIITRINGHQFKDMYEADRVLSQARTGEVVQYDILRNNKIITLNLIPVRYGVSFVILFQNLAGLFVMIFGFFIVFKKPLIKRAFYLGIGMLLFGTLYNLSALRFGIFSYPSTYGYIRHITVMMSLFFGITFLFVSSFYFPQKVDIAEKEWIRNSIFSIAGVFALFSISLNFISHNAFLDIISNNSVLLLLLYFVVIRIIYRKFYTKEYRRINRPVFWLFVSFFVGRTALIYLSAKQPQLLVSFNYLLITDFILIFIAYYYIIVKYRLLGLDIRIKKNIQYSIVTVVWQIIALVILIATIYSISRIDINFPNIHIQGTNLEVLNKPLSPSLQDVYAKLFLTLISIIITILWLFFKKKVQHSLAKRFHRTSFDYRKAATDLSRFLAHNFTLEDLTKNFARELADLTYLKRVGILIFKNEEQIVAHDFYGVKNEELAELLTASGKKLAAAIKEYSEDFSVDYLPAPHNNILRDFGFRFIQPIKTKQKLLGALLVGEKKSESSLNKDDFEFLNNISGQIFVAIENSFLYEDLTKQERIKHELEIARKIQLASLPNTIPNISGLEISGISLPALEVGGDFYDFLETKNGDFMVIIGDVSGKGTSAALYMSKIQGVMRTLYEFRLSPRQLFIRTNHLLYRYLEKGFFISAMSINFVTGTNKAYVSRAGHLPLYLYQSELYNVETLTTKGMVLGLTRDKVFERNMEEDEIHYKPGDIFVLVTDGIIEAKNSMLQEYGEENLINVIKQNASKSAEEIRNMILDSVRTFAGNESQYDDVTVVIVKII